MNKHMTYVFANLQNQKSIMTLKEKYARGQYNVHSSRENL